MSPHANGGPSLLSGIPKSVKSIPLTYDSKDPEGSARALVVALRPEWESSPGELEFVAFKDGITNTLYKATKKTPGKSDYEADSDAILLRAYGNGTDVLIDRDREALSHSLLAKHNLAPPLLARFNNGLLYKFIVGTPCSYEDFARPEVFRPTARVLAQWHGDIPISAVLEPDSVQGKEFAKVNALLHNKPLPNIWTNMQKWIIALPNTTETERSRNATLQQELEFATATFADTTGLDAGAYVLSHNDLLCGNVIMHPHDRDLKDGEDEEVSFIDYEYAIPAPQAFDLANHFAEWAGYDCDHAACPTRSQRTAFLREYVASYRSFSDARKKKMANGNGHSNGNGTHSQSPSLDDDFRRIYAEVDACRGLPGLYWGIWALIQAMISDIDFDYVKYADGRLGEYWAWKGEYDGSRKKSGKEMPLRERRWAQESP